MNNCSYVRASDVAFAVNEASRNVTAKFIAGATNLIDLMKENVARPSRLIDITREGSEKMLIAYDWGEAFTALNLTVKPAFDELFNIQFAELARAHQDALLDLMLDDFALDIQRSRDWSISLVQYATAQRPANTDLFKQWIEQWKPLVYRGMEELVELFGQAPCPLEPRVVSAKVQAAHHAFLARCGLDTVPTAKADVQKSGIDAIGDMVAWGAHFCLFYETKKDLLDALISYCKSGLENKEYCLWIVNEPLTIEEATAALKEAVPHLDRYLVDSSMEIVSVGDFSFQGGQFDRKRVTDALFSKLAGVSARGYAGVRLTGDASWVTKKDWTPFCELEEGINEVIGNQRLAVLCSYSLAACDAYQILDAVRSHQFALARREENWVVIETAALKRAKADIKRLNEELEQGVAERTSQLIKASEALGEARAELARVTRLTAMGELTASIGHELNQPLAGAVANGDACLAWLSREPPNLDEARAAAEHMIEAVTRATDIVRRIRDLFKKAAPERVRVNINEVIEETLGLIRSEASRNNVSFKRELDSQLPFVLGDRVQLQQVVLNLVMNGMEAMRSVDDRIRQLRIRSARQDPNQVLVTVADSGTGIAPQIIRRIFEAFYSTKPNGIGMGLAISRSIIEAHGGRLWAEPKTGQGATLQFTLPAGIEGDEA